MKLILPLKQGDGPASLEVASDGSLLSFPDLTDLCVTAFHIQNGASRVVPGLSIRWAAAGGFQLIPAGKRRRRGAGPSFFGLDPSPVPERR